MIVVASVLAGLGLVSILTKRTLLGIMVGVQLLVLGAAIIFTIAGLSSGQVIDGNVFSFFVLIGGVGQLVVGLVLAVRLFAIRKRVTLDHLRAFKH